MNSAEATRDLRVVACNYRSSTGVASVGSLAYVCYTNPGGGNDRIPILLRSRGGRWVRKWEAMHRLYNFRHKTIPPQHPRYDQISELCVELDGDSVRWLTEACDRESR